MKKIIFVSIALLLSMLLYSITFTDINAGLDSVAVSSVAWGDYDNDGDLDILLTGENSSYQYISKIYRNDNGSFTDISAGLSGVAASSVAWGDYDNDGDLDILITGSLPPSENPTSKIYRNDNGVFTDINAILTGVYHGSVAWGDYDNDGDLDILLTGDSSGGGATRISKIYRNDNGSFTDINAALAGVRQSSVAWGDYDNDGDLDILLTGCLPSGNPTTKIYRNDNGSFTDINAELTGVYVSSIAWGDYDNDGDLDILLTGDDGTDIISPISKIYRNDNGSFTDINAALTDVCLGSAAWGDYDNDGDLDILMTGVWYEYYLVYHSIIYLNDCSIHNSAPANPSNLRTSLDGAYTIFQWDASVDAQTPSTGLSYVLRIGASPEGVEILSPMANSNGYRLIPVKGNANSTCRWKIKTSALPDSCFWGVQAIDGAFAGSGFSSQQYLYGSHINLLTPAFLQCGNLPINDSSDEVRVEVKNTGSQDVIISNLHFLDTTSQFAYDYQGLSISIPPGDIDTIYVWFTPTTLGSVVDTLFIESNAVNAPVLKIRLAGTGTYVPPKIPGNINITQDGYDMQLTWDAVTEDIHDNPITPDGYIVLYSEDDINYFFLAFTPVTEYTHNWVAHFRDNMFYKVIAYIDYGRGNIERLIGLNGTKQRIRLNELILY